MRGFSVWADSGKNHVYWVKAGDESQDPIILSTGVGVGMNGYINFVNSLIGQYPNRTIILLETSCINLQPAASLLSETDSLCEIDDMFLDLKLDKCTWIGHSYGTVIAGWVVKHRPHYIRKLVLVDPICFRTWDASSFRAIFYTPPGSMETKLFQVLFATDPAIACGFARHVNWFGPILFPEQIIVPTQIFLAENDFFLDYTGLHSYLNHRISKDNLSHINVTSMDALHASFLFCPTSSKNLIAALQAL
ncbi:hypothetical protein DSO57_1034000 [Entomophthora muscae]|uniref:Uncharacterized protein n=2 Tax=Entomophthora muscae TaxID=34485 RepID=A0ACC2U8Z2_9FUNG|nr:hypothetical protein DSO57_1034000 [Entomophthora muscae]